MKTSQTSVSFFHTNHSLHSATPNPQSPLSSAFQPDNRPAIGLLTTLASFNFLTVDYLV